MLIALLTIITTALICAGLTRRYAIVEIQYKYSNEGLSGKVRDCATGLAIGRLSGMSGLALYLVDRKDCIDTGLGIENLISSMPRYIGGLWFFRCRKHPYRMIVKRHRYNQLLQYASGYKKLPASRIYC